MAESFASKTLYDWPLGLSDVQQLLVAKSEAATYLLICLPGITVYAICNMMG